MKVLKLKVFQETACYKKPFAFKNWETYPLPPYSTVKGMLHRVLREEKEFIPMIISIQGDYENKFINYQSMHFYKKDTNTKMPLNIHLLYNVNLIIHVYAEENVLNGIVEGLKNSDEYLSLGRKEDIVRIDAVSFVEVNEVDINKVGKIREIEKPIYIPLDKLPEDIDGINYRLNWKYKIVDNLRQWEKIDVKYVEEGQVIYKNNYLEDEEGDIVYFNTTLMP